MKCITNLCVTGILYFVLSCVAFGQNSNEAKQVTDTYFISNATVVVSPDKQIKDGDIIIKKGIITEVGRNLTPPWDAEIVDADSLFVYAAFICAATNTGYNLKQEEAPKVEIPGNPPMAVAGITPQHTVRDAYDAKAVSDMGKQGFGYVHVLPKGQMLPGQGSLVTTGGASLSQSIIKENFSHYAQFVPATQHVYPSNMLGVMASFRNIYKNASAQQSYARAYKNNPAGLTHPEIKEEYTALYPVINAKNKMFFKAEKPKNILRALTLQKELGFGLVLTEVKYVSPILQQVKRANSPVLLSL